MPYVNVDFFTPIGAKGTYIDLRGALLSAGKLPPEKRLLDHGEAYKLFLGDVEELSDGMILGTAACVRMYGLPGKFVGKNFSLNDLELAEKDGVAEEVSFLLSHKLRTFALQRNGGFRSARLERFLNEITDIPLVLDPKVRADKLSRLNGIEEFSEVSFKLSDPLQNPAFSETIPGVAATIKDAAKSGTLATVELTIRLQTGSDHPQNVGTFKKLLKYVAGRDDVTKLSAKGRRPSQKIEDIDLIRDRIVAGKTVSYGKDGRRLDGKQCKLLLRKAMNTNQLFLENLLKKAE